MTLFHMFENTRLDTSDSTFLQLLFISFDVLIMTQGVEGSTGQSCIFLTKGPKTI